MLNWGTNAYGTGGSGKWLTSNAGTGNWEEYIYKVQCGSTGTFSSTNYFYLNGGSTPTTESPLIWYIAYATVIDITDNDESINDLTIRMTSAEQKITEDAITNTVKKNFYTKTETEGAITSKGYQTSSQVQQTVDALQLKFTESGGYNSIRNSAFENGTTYWIDLGNSYIREINSKKYLYLNIPNGGRSMVTQNIWVPKIPIDGKMYLSAEVYTASVELECSGFGAVIWYTDGTFDDYTWNGCTILNHTGTYDYLIGKNIYINTNKTVSCIDIRLWTTPNWIGNNDGASYTNISLIGGEFATSLVATPF